MHSDVKIALMEMPAKKILVYRPHECTFKLLTWLFLYLINLLNSLTPIIESLPKCNLQLKLYF